MAVEGFVPSNTMHNNRWAETTFMKWAQESNKRAHSHDSEVPLDLLQSHDAQKVCKFMRYFVLEAKCEDGDRYPACTIRSLLSAFNQILRANDVPFSMLDKKDITFKPLMMTLDSVCSELHKDGIGVVQKSAMVISPEHEDAFWEQDYLVKAHLVSCVSLFFSMLECTFV